MKKEKEIGGYLEMEELSGEEYYPDLIALNLGRTALLYLLQQKDYKMIYLPNYLCDSVIQICSTNGYEVKFYQLNEKMEPIVAAPLEERACLYLVNYYGQLTDLNIQVYKRKYGRIIVDHVHAFFQKPIDGVDTIYSCRKFFGLPDGAYLATDLKAGELPVDHSAERMGHVLGRYEDCGSSHYHTMLGNAEKFNKEPVKLMSKLTHNLLRGIDYEQVRKKRNDNYHTLDRLLGEKNGIGFCRTEGPLCYPFYVPDGIKIRKKLAEYKIYVPVYWGNVVKDMAENSIEHDRAANILPLPCDQRYGREEMERVAGVLLKLLEKKI